MRMPSLLAGSVGGLALAVSALAQTTPPPGKWTVIVHGRTGNCSYPTNYNDLTSASGWMRQLATRIESLSPGNVSIYTMNAATQNLTTVNGGTGGTNPLDPTKHHVVMFDWGATSDFAPAICNPPGGGDRNGYAYAAGDSLHALLHRWNAHGQVFGLIGYSRGSIVISEAARRLMAEGNNPAQVVYLDGEGCDGAGGCGLYTDGSFDAWLPLNGSVRFDNILETVNERYLAPSPCATDLGGHIKNKCANVNLATAYAHTTWGLSSSCLPSFSQGSITGYLISGLMVQSGRYAYPNPTGGILDPNPFLVTAPPSPFNGDLAFASLAGWFGSGGTGAASISSLSGQTTLHLARGQSQTHNFTVIPACAGTVRFAAATDSAVGDCVLSVVLQSTGVPDQELGPVPLSVLPTTLGTTQQLSIPSIMQGRVGLLKFSVVGTTGQGGLHLAAVSLSTCGAPCYANCDGSTAAPMLTANDFQCYLNKFSVGDPYANCDGSTATPTLTANDFQCFLNAFSAGCS